MYKIYNCWINKKIYGVLLKAKNSDSLMILSHGFNGSYQDNLNYALDLVSAGISCFLFDFCGGSTYSKSTGKTTKMSVLSELDDLFDVYKAMLVFKFKNIYLFGESQGGLVSALAASKLKEKIKALILLYPAFNIVDNAKSEYENKEMIADHFGLWGVPLGKCYYEDIYDLDVFYEMSQYTGPVYIMHGSHDEIVSVEYSKKAFRIYQNCQLKIMPYIGHGFYGPVSLNAGQEIIEFLKKL